MFETRSDAWEKVGLSFEVNKREVKKAQWQAVFFLIGLIAVDIASHILLNHESRQERAARRLLAAGTSRSSPTGAPATSRRSSGSSPCCSSSLSAGAWPARSAASSDRPSCAAWIPATAGTFGFLIRLLTMGIALILALSVAGASLQSLAVGGAFTAVIVGLAAQQTLGNVIAGMVLLSARPFRVGERVRFQAGAVGGQVEGIVSSLGLLYTTLTAGADQIMIPNNVVLAAAVVPLREPDSVDVKVRLTSGVRPSQVQAILDQELSTATRSGASVLLEEVDGDDVVVRIQATPEMSDEGAKLADEIMVALSSVTGEHEAVDSAHR